MKCSCGGTQFRQTVTVKVDLEAVFDEDGDFCDFVGDLGDQIGAQNIIEKDGNLICTECEQEYDEDEDPDRTALLDEEDEEEED